MFDYIKGKITKKGKNHIVIEKLGFGLLVEVPDSEKFKENIVYTYLLVRQEDVRLLGFVSEEERDLFLKLIQIHGVGVKHALNIISNFSVEEFIEIVENGDVDRLTEIQGIGNKTAQRIIVELKGKIEFSESDELSQLVSALVNLGYDKKESVKVAKKVMKETKDIKEALKKAINILNSF
jgi:Holliday junction DNA helicase RuvA